MNADIFFRFQFNTFISIVRGWVFVCDKDCSSALGKKEVSAELNSVKFIHHSFFKYHQKQKLRPTRDQFYNTCQFQE